MLGLVLQVAKLDTYIHAYIYIRMFVRVYMHECISVTNAVITRCVAWIGWPCRSPKDQWSQNGQPRPRNLLKPRAVRHSAASQSLTKKGKHHSRGRYSCLERYIEIQPGYHTNEILSGCGERNPHLTWPLPPFKMEIDLKGCPL